MSAVRGVVLDAGAFIALERRDRVMTELARRLAEDEIPLVTSAGVVAQVWRGGSRAPVPIAFLLRRTTVVDLTQRVAKVIGRMLGATRTKDPIDAHIVLLARERGWTVLTSDPDDLRRIDPALAVEAL
ncbi:MAG TPA: PIN domain-containing protein [Polyangiaceae bacterium]